MSGPFSPELLSPDFQPKRRTRAPSVTQPKLTFAAPPEPRRQSLPVRFPARTTGVDFRHRSPSPPKPAQGRRGSSKGSPPPPSAYESRVSFDTFDNPDAVDFSLTLRAKHTYYELTESARTFLFGFDEKQYSEDALEWLFDELIEDGDEVICLRVLDRDDKSNRKARAGKLGYRKQARQLMKFLQDKVDEDKSISLVLEFAVGKVPNVMRRMTAIYDPTCLVVGTRGRSKHGLQNLLPGSVSKDCLQNSEVPVLVVPPTAKRAKKKLARQAKSSRRSYMEIVERTDAAGGLSLSSFERGRSRVPHATSSTADWETRATEAPAAAAAASSGPVLAPVPPSPPPDNATPPLPPSSDGLPTTTLRPPDVPILRVNSKDIM